MITSTKNPAVINIKKLLKQASERKKQQIFVAEGKRLVYDIIESGQKPVNLFVTEYFLKKKANLPQGCRYELVSEQVMTSMSDTKTPQGIVGLFNIPRYNISKVAKETVPLLLILDNVSDPGNMGTIFRTFEAAGGTGIILLGNCTDPFSPKCIRSTMGSIVRLPVFFCENTDNLKNFLEKFECITVYASDLTGEDYITCDYRKPCAFVIGNEAKGISLETKTLSDKIISIPMKGRVESLNAAVSAALLSFEANKQRRMKNLFVDENVTV